MITSNYKIKRGNKRYGVPYMGSKNTLVKDIISLLPSVHIFIDIFAGGCSITHGAIESGKYQSFILNDRESSPTLFLDAVKGKYKDEHTWYSRDDFFNLKDINPYVKWCWSFGNSGECYLYSRHIETVRKLQWLMVFETDPIRRFIVFKNIIEWMWQEGYLFCYGDHKEQGKISEKLISNIKKLYDNGFDPSVVPSIANVKINESITRMTSLQSLQRVKLCPSLGNLDRLRRLQSLQSVKSLEGTVSLDNIIKVYQGDYRDVPIPQDALIYCDPPYKGTHSYQKGTQFDYDAFYDWCEKQTVPVFISEYQMPSDRFKSISQWDKVSLMQAGANNQYVKEHLYIPLCNKDLVAYYEYYGHENDLF